MRAFRAIASATEFSAEVSNHQTSLCCLVYLFVWFQIEDARSLLFHTFGQLLFAAGIVSGRNPLSILQEDLSACKLQVSPALEEYEDLHTWNDAGWPEMCYVVMEGGGPSTVAETVKFALSVTLDAAVHIFSIHIVSHTLLLYIIFCLSGSSW